MNRTGDGTVRRSLVDGDLPFPKEMSEYNVYFPPLGRNELFFLLFISNIVETSAELRQKFPPTTNVYIS